jgi:hypothetical protein
MEAFAGDQPSLALLVLSGSGRNVCNLPRIDCRASTTALAGIADLANAPMGSLP